jgi:hypothetical protein
MKAFAAAILATAAVALKIKELSYSDVKALADKYGVPKPTYSEAKALADKYGVPSDLEAVPSDIEAAQYYEELTYSEVKALADKYGVPEPTYSEVKALADLEAAQEYDYDCRWEGCGPPYDGTALAQE